MDVGRRLSNQLGLGRRGAERRWSYVDAGLVGIVAGLVAAVWPEITALVLILVLGVRAVVTGALQIAAAIGVFALLPGVALTWSPWQVRTGRALVLRIGRGTSTRG